MNAFPWSMAPPTNHRPGRPVDTSSGTAQTGATMKSARTTSGNVLVLIR
jgi:hypothetical protein